jgi:ribonucleoside-diphosphate reductase alpha chain
LGLMGFTDLVERLGWCYESEPAYELIDQITEFVSYHAIDASADLAAERGPYPNFAGSRWSKGMVPFDTLEELERDRGVPVDVDRAARLDWDTLRDKVSRGMRNATLMAIAPTASIGLVAGTTPGLDPQFSQLFSRATSSGKFLEVNRNLVRALQERGLWQQVRHDLLRSQGDVQAIEAIPADLRAVYRTSFQLSPYAFLEVAARAQKWIDQAISRNMYLETRDVGDMTDIYSAAWRKGVKTTYYLHVKPRHTAEQSTVKVNKAAATGRAGQGFGFAAASQASPPATAPATAAVVEPAPAEPIPQPVPSGRGFGAAVAGRGFVAARSTPVVDVTETGRESTTQAPTLIAEIEEGITCPVDPQERLQCEACQ